MDISEKKQQELFDSISDDFELHYSEKYTEQFRRRFVNTPMFKGIDLKGKKVLDAMCGTGQVTNYLLEHGADVTGLDISPNLIKKYQEKYPVCKAICASVVETGLPDASFDIVVVMAGLHHVHPFVNQTLNEVARVLKPGGYFLFMEPHKGSIPDVFRQLWYKVDGIFESNEAAVNLDHMESFATDKFEFAKTKYAGNIAFLLVYNSLIFRIPISLKKYYSPFLLWVEGIINPIQNKLISCIAVAQWRKK